MTIGERIKKVRKENDYTQQALADRIGIKQNSIALIESGKRNASDQVILAICREFNLNEEWLRTGDGEKSKPAATTALDALAAERGLSRSAYIAIEKFLNLKAGEQDALIRFCTEVAAAINGDDADASSSAYAAARAVDADALHAELDRQLVLEEGAEAASGAS